MFFAALACGCATEEPVSSGQQEVISDQFHSDGEVGFMFLPPLVAAPTFGGPAEPAASPTVRIDELDASGGIARTILTAPAMLTADEFRFQWITADHVLSTDATYRIGVFVPGERRLGFVDVDLLASKREVRNVDTDVLIPLVDGKKLNITFRIERAAVDLDGDGALDWLDGCPDDDLKTAPGACGCHFDDTDSDGDGAALCQDQCPLDPVKIEPGQCGCDRSDQDYDGDGVADCLDLCNDDPAKVDPGRCGCGVSEVNSDADGTPDCLDECPLDPLKLWPGECGCGQDDFTDDDGDGVLACHESCDLDPAKLAAGICGCGVADTDADGDGTADCDETCTYDPTKTEPGVCGCGFRDDADDGCAAPARGNVCRTAGHPLIVAADLGWSLPQDARDDLTSNPADLVAWASITTDIVNRCLASYVYNAAYIYDTRYVDQNWYDPAQASRTPIWLPGCGDENTPPIPIPASGHDPRLQPGFIAPAGYPSDPGGDGSTFSLTDLWASQWVIDDVACACTAELEPINPIYCSEH